jgi:carbon storage regulator
MLMISRRVGDRIVIGDDVEIVVTEIHRSTVKLGVKGPRGVMILRGEVHDAVEAANRAASNVPVEAIAAIEGGGGKFKVVAVRPPAHEPEPAQSEAKKEPG